MNLKELAWPVRIYWDLPERGSDRSRARDICIQIAELKILFLSLRDLSVPLSPACLEILDCLKNRNVAVSLTVSSKSDLSSQGSLLSGSPVRSLLLHCVSLQELDSALASGMSVQGSAVPVGISFEVREENFVDLPGVVALCKERGVRDLVFPIQRLCGKTEIFSVPGSESERVAAAISSTGIGGMRVTIHDPFLWPLFFPGTDYHEGGCQAANSMFYISEALAVYPCPAMPHELGSLHETDLRGIILSPRRKELRSGLMRPAAECLACGISEKCLGGCRGRALAAEGDMDRKDPSCRLVAEKRV